MKLTSIVGGLAVAVLVAASGPAQVTAAEGQEKVTLTGCAVKGNGDGDGFLLANSCGADDPHDHYADPGRVDGQLDNDQRDEAGPDPLLARR